MAALLGRIFVSNTHNCVRVDADFTHACCSNDCSLRNDAVVEIILSVASLVCVSILWLTQENPQNLALS